MKIIRTITDMEILGAGGLSPARPRLTARAVVKNPEGLYAVMYTGSFGLYSLPGGGVEDGEDVLAALRREIFEETGCSCDEVAEIGVVLENRASCDFTQENHYFAVTTRTENSRAHLTKAELARGTEAQWHTLPEVMRLIGEREHGTTQRKFIQARDLAALREYAIDALELTDIRPSQFYVSEEKLRRVREWFRSDDLSNFEAVPIKLVRGKLFFTDGHTRALAAHLARLRRIPLVWDEDELDWELYGACVDACAQRGVLSVADLEGRVLGKEEYEEKWIGWCGELRREGENIYRILEDGFNA